MNFVNEIYSLIYQFGFFDMDEPLLIIAGHMLIACLCTMIVLVPIGVAWIIVKWIVRLGRYDN